MNLNDGNAKNTANTAHQINTEISNEKFSNQVRISPFTVNLNDANTENATNAAHQMNTEISNENFLNYVPISSPNNNMPISPLTENLNAMNAENAANAEISNENFSNNMPSIHQYIDIIKSGSLSSMPLHLHPSTKVLQERFNNFTCNYLVYHCYYCKERWHDLRGKHDDDKFECNKYINDRNKNTVKMRTLST